MLLHPLPTAAFASLDCVRAAQSAATRLMCPIGWWAAIGRDAARSLCFDGADLSRAARVGNDAGFVPVA